MVCKSLAFILVGLAAASSAGAQIVAPSARGEARAFSVYSNFDGGYLGVEAEEVTKENFSRFGLREVRGVAIEKVVDGSPAQTAGLQNGDVIVRFNGEAVTSVRKLSRLIADVAPDHQVKLNILRSGDEREVTATLGKRVSPAFDGTGFAMAVPGRVGSMPLPPMRSIPNTPDMPALPPMTAMPPMGADGNVFTFRRMSGRQIGIGITPLTKQLAEHFGVSNGVMVSDVRENSPAAKAGLKAGDIIVEVEGREVKSDRDLILSIGEKKQGDVQLTFVRDRNRQTVRVTPEDVTDGFRTFDAPAALLLPSERNLVAPAAPMPLNQMLIPGRVL